MTDITELAAQWPTLDHVAEGIDRFSECPIAGVPLPTPADVATLRYALEVLVEECGGGAKVDAARAYLDAVSGVVGDSQSPTG